MRRFQAIFLLRALAAVCFATVFHCVPAQAQNCAVQYEVITTLRPPTFGFPSVWDAKQGIRDSLLQTASGATMDGGTVFTLSRRVNKESFAVEELILAEINRRGRALKEARYPAREAEEPVKLIRAGNELVALSNMRGGSGKAELWARVSWYDLEGKYRREKILRDPVFDQQAISLLTATEGKGLVVVMRAVNRKDASDENGVLVRLTPGGEVVWRRVYRPGIPNALFGLVPVDSSAYIAAGRIRLEDGRMAGWAMKLAFDGAVQWQRTYPRGGFSVLRHAALTREKTAEGRGFVLSGDSTPLDGGPEAAWVMAIDAQGEPLWQRYYRRGDYHLGGNWIATEPDGRIVTMMNARAVEGKGGTNHIRMLTLSPRGVLIQDESYTEGLSARATDYAPGWNGERILTAVIEDDIGAAEDENPAIVVIGLAADEPALEPGSDAAKAPPEPEQKGWVLVAPALDPYNDPCLPRRAP